MLRSQSSNEAKTKPYVFLKLLSNKKSNTKHKFSFGFTGELQPSHFDVVEMRKDHRTRTSILSKEVISFMNNRHLVLNLKHKDYLGEGHLIV